MEKIILTFDDSPSKKFKELLDYLIKKEYKAILFVIGKKVNKQNEKFLIEAIKKGFLIGNHSYTHPHFRKISFEKAKLEILKTDKIIEKLYKKAKLKRSLKVFRFPFFDQGGFKRNKLQRFLKNLGYRNPYYSSYSFLMKTYRGEYDLFRNLDPKDWSEKTTPKKAILRIKKAKDGDVIGLHDHIYAFNHTTKPICDYLQSRGFNFTY